MRLKKKLLKKSRLYVLIDRDTVKGPVLNIVRKLSQAGVDIIQLRDKNSSASAILKEALLVNKELEKTRTLFIVNDYADIAKLSGSDGLHIGQRDISARRARQLLGKDKIIGVTCSSLKQIQEAQDSGADYAAVGPVFKTRTKLGLRPIGLKALEGLSKKISIPVFAIGNINSVNLEKITSSGINRIAVCRAVLKSKDMAKAAKYFSAKLRKIK